MQVHQCGCDSDSCNAELCAAAGKIWTAECPTWCTECGGSDNAVDSHDEGEEPHGKSDDETSETEEHDSKDHGSSDDETVVDGSSAHGRSCFVTIAMTTLFAATVSLSGYENVLCCARSVP